MTHRATALVSALLAMSGAHAADLVLHDTAVYTVNDKQPWATALVIRAGRIAYVGDEAGLKPYLEGAKVLDLHGAMVLPGFHDAHIHPIAGALRLLQCNLADAKSGPQLEAGIRAEAANGHPWVFCNAVPEALGKGLSRARLDALVPDRPAFLRTYDGFRAWVNSPALRAAGLDPEGTAPEATGLMRDPRTHKPTGLLTGDATSLVRNKVPPPTLAQDREALTRASAMANAQGITSLFDAAATPDLLDAYHTADQAGALTLRVVAAQRVDADLKITQVDDFIRRRDAVQGRRFRADAAKIFMDEEISDHTAAMLAPYADAPDSNGPAYAPEDVAALDALVTRLDAEGFLLHFHAMGDRAVRTALDALGQAAQANGPRDRRPQIAHVGVMDPADIPRFAKLGVTGNFTSLWFQQEDPSYLSARQALGPERAKWMYPMGSLLSTGARVTLGSDWPQVTLSPLDGIQYAVTRQPLDGKQASLQPEQRTTLAQAIAAYTKDAAWAVREDKLDGTLETGKAADLVVLDKNLFKMDVQSIHTARVLLTLLDGTPVYRDPKSVWPDTIP